MLHGQSIVQDKRYCLDRRRREFLSRVVMRRFLGLPQIQKDDRNVERGNENEEINENPTRA
jgi:hypothetical protein